MRIAFRRPEGAGRHHHELLLFSQRRGASPRGRGERSPALHASGPRPGGVLRSLRARGRGGRSDRSRSGRGDQLPCRGVGPARLQARAQGAGLATSRPPPHSPAAGAPAIAGVRAVLPRLQSPLRALCAGRGPRLEGPQSGGRLFDQRDLDPQLPRLLDRVAGPIRSSFHCSSGSGCGGGADRRGDPPPIFPLPPTSFASLLTRTDRRGSSTCATSGGGRQSRIRPCSVWPASGASFTTTTRCVAAARVESR